MMPADWRCPKCKRPPSTWRVGDAARPDIAVCVPCDVEDATVSWDERLSRGWHLGDGTVVPLPPADPDLAPAGKVVISTADALVALERYFGPMADFTTLDVDIELGEVIQLFRPGLEEWGWDIDEKELVAGVLAFVGGKHNSAQVRVDMWDTDLGGDEGYQTGYRVEIKARVHELAPEPWGAPAASG